MARVRVDLCALSKGGARNILSITVNRDVKDQCSVVRKWLGYEDIRLPTQRPSRASSSKATLSSVSAARYTVAFIGIGHSPARGSGDTWDILDLLNRMNSTSLEPIFVAAAHQLPDGVPAGLRIILGKIHLWHSYPSTCCQQVLECQDLGSIGDISVRLENHLLGRHVRQHLKHRFTTSQKVLLNRHGYSQRRPQQSILNRSAHGGHEFQGGSRWLDEAEFRVY